MISARALFTVSLSEDFEKSTSTSLDDSGSLDLPGVEAGETVGLKMKQIQPRVLTGTEWVLSGLVTLSSTQVTAAESW